MRTSTSPSDFTGFRFIQVDLLANFVKSLACPQCQKQQVLHLGFQESRRGLYSKFNFVCPECEDAEYSFSSCVTTRSGHAANLQFVMAIYEIGGHRTAAERFCTTMNMPQPPVKSAWYKISEKIHRAEVICADECKEKAAKESRKDLQIPDGEVGEATCSFDCTWQTRGFQSKNCVATALSVNGKKCKVLDTVTLSNHL